MRSRTVLIVDDDANIRSMVRICLESDGYLVRQAVNGADALEQMQREAPDVVLIDLAMPAMDGMTTLAEIRNFWPNHPPRIIVISAFGTLKNGIDAIRLGAADFLQKPFTPDDLRISLASVLPTEKEAGNDFTSD